MPFQRRPDRAIEMGLDLVVLSRDAPPAIVNLFSTSCVGEVGTSLPCDLPVRALQIMPDGIGGTLVTWTRGSHMVGQGVVVQWSLTRVTGEGAIEERQVKPQFWLELIGQAGTALAFDGDWKAIDVTTGNIRWTSRLPNLAVLAARPDSGLATLDQRVR